MLKTKHRRRTYHKVRFKRGLVLVSSDTFVILHPRPRSPIRSRLARRFGDSEELTLEEFALRFGDRRDDLAYRKLQGEELSPADEAALQALNSRLRGLMKPAPRLEKDVRETLDEVLRTLPPAD